VTGEGDLQVVNGGELLVDNGDIQVDLVVNGDLKNGQTSVSSHDRKLMAVTDTTATGTGTIGQSVTVQQGALIVDTSKTIPMRIPTTLSISTSGELHFVNVKPGATQLQVLGQVTIASFKIKVILASGYVPSLTDTIRVMSCGSLDTSSSFSVESMPTSNGLIATVTATNGEMVIAFEAAPSPSPSPITDIKDPSPSPSPADTVTPIVEPEGGGNTALVVILIIVGVAVLVAIIVGVVLYRKHVGGGKHSVAPKSLSSQQQQEAALDDLEQAA
jgi:hypothetical protein